MKQINYNSPNGQGKEFKKLVSSLFASFHQYGEFASSSLHTSYSKQLNKQKEEHGKIMGIPD